ncbi:MAG: hypothetical protein M4579_003208 [Chaenotheca gracillima]|nr:MAG: hypothetical protein M4579_003208 [Chaenotheca gracillima]
MGSQAHENGIKLEVNGNPAVHASDTASDDFLNIPDVPHSDPAHIRIIHIGAGASGLLTAYKARKFLRNYDLVCYEKNAAVGGTWLENKYPGCGCDIPAHIYTYTFEPNPNWSSFYANSDEIEQYFLRFYEKYELQPHFQFNTTVISAAWDEKEGKYHVELERNGERFSDWCHVLINGSGVANRWKWPDIKGLETFKGSTVHSAAWDKNVSLEGKRIAVIGNGSSAVQIIPEMQKIASHLTVFMRSPQWISPPTVHDKLEEAKAGRVVSNGTHEKSTSEKVQSNGTSGQEVASREAQFSKEENQYTYSEEERAYFAANPEKHLEYRRSLEKAIVSAFGVFYRGSDFSNAARGFIKKQMLERIGPGHEYLKEHIIPEWSPGCKRMSPAPGYLECLTKRNVTVVYDLADEITSNAVKSKGNVHEVDAIVCGTGFHFQLTPHFKLHGVDGISMHDFWKPFPKAYCGTTAPHFPNYFIISGPRSNWGQGCAMPTHEAQIEYTMKCIAKMSTERIKALEVKTEATRALNEYFDSWHKRSVWGDTCKSWYKGHTTDGPVMLWGGSILHMMKTLKEPRYEHYDIRYRGHMWDFLGNGRTAVEMEGNWDESIPYIRNEDVPWEL